MNQSNHYKMLALLRSRHQDAENVTGNQEKLALACGPYLGSVSICFFLRNRGATGCLLHSQDLH